MGINASFPFLAGTVGLIISGYISDKYFIGKRRNFIIAADLLTAVFLYLTYSTSAEGFAMVALTLSGFFVCLAFGAIWAVPMNMLPPEVMGGSSSFLNFAGQIAGFIAPIVIGFLVQISGGKFATSFSFLIIAILFSAGIALTVRDTDKPEPSNS